MRAIQFDRFGGPEVLVEAELPEPVVHEGQIRVDVAAAGVNFSDTSRIRGSYANPPPLPHVPGIEVVGRDESGRRVAALTMSGGGYAQRAVVDRAAAVAVPDGVTDGQAAALLVQGLTAWYLLRGSARIAPGESVVVNAAAGGVGSLAVQLAKDVGAGRVIAVASTEEKRRLALSLGADAAVDSEPDGYADRVRDANGGRGVDVVLDAVGGAVLSNALAALAPFGRVVSYGDASRGGRAAVDVDALSHANIAVAGFWLAPILALPGIVAEPLEHMFASVAAGRLRPLVGAEYPLADAAGAHRDLLARRTTGKVWLRP